MDVTERVVIHRKPFMDLTEREDSSNTNKKDKGNPFQSNPFMDLTERGLIHSKPFMDLTERRDSSNTNKQDKGNLMTKTI